MADAWKTGWQRVQKETANELIGAYGHVPGLVAIARAIVFVLERNPIVIDCLDAVIVNGDAMRVVAEVVDHLARPAEGRLGMDHPFDAAEFGYELWEGVPQSGDAAAKS